MSGIVRGGNEGRGRTSAAARLVVAGLLAVVVLSARPASASTAAEALEASIDVERSLLLADVEDHERLVARRAQVHVQLQNLYATIDYALRQSTISEQEVSEILERIDQTERERAQIVDAQRHRVLVILERVRRLRELESRAGILRARDESESGVLTGSWEVSLLPSGQSGVFELQQNGVIVGGTYSLDGGWTGSLQGTLVNRKIYLVRIDSRLGRSMELEGYISEDGTSIRGSWLNYDLGAEGGAEGQWSATRTVE